MQPYVFLGFFFFSEVLNLYKFLCIVFILLRILGDFEYRQNSLQNCNKNENKKTKQNKTKTKKIRPKFSHANVNKTNKNS